MNIPDHICESLETIFWVKILKFFDVDPDPGSGIFLTLDLGSGMEIFRSGINFPNPQRCKYRYLFFNSKSTVVVTPNNRLNL